MTIKSYSQHQVGDAFEVRRFLMVIAFLLLHSKAEFPTSHFFIVMFLLFTGKSGEYSRVLCMPITARARKCTL